MPSTGPKSKCNPKYESSRSGVRKQVSIARPSLLHKLQRSLYVVGVNSDDLFCATSPPGEILSSVSMSPSSMFWQGEAVVASLDTGSNRMASSISITSLTTVRGTSSVPVNGKGPPYGSRAV